MTPRTLRALATGAIIGFVIWIAAQTRTDADIWGHVRFGLDILDDGVIHDTDPYSFTSDRPWVNHEWLSEVVFALAWRAGGTSALILLKLACTFSTLALMASLLKAKGIVGHPRLILLGLTLAGMLPRTTSVRPQMFSVLLFAALMRVFVHSERRGPAALLWTIPIVALWTNLHGGWIVGLATVGLWCTGAAIALRIQPNRAALALACTAAAAGATLLNPYGAGLWQFLLETVRFGREAIPEWGPIWTDRTTLIFWSLSALLLVTALRRTSWPRNPATVLIPIAWGLASLRVSRLDAFFALSVIGLLAEPLSLLFSRRSVDREPMPRPWIVGGVAVALTALLAIPMSRRAFTCIGFLTPRFPEPQVIEFIHQRHLSGRMVTFFNWGEYGIWHVPRTLKVSMDGRRETVYTDGTISRHLKLYDGTDEGLAYLHDLDPDYVWLPRDLRVVPLLTEQGWTTVFDGPRSTILSPSDRAQGPPMLVSEATPPRCFPGP